MPEPDRPKREAASATDERYRAIARACVDIVSEQGVTAISLAAVARRAGVAPDVLRGQFATRKALLAAVFGRPFEMYQDRAAEILFEPDAAAADRFWQLIDEHVGHIFALRDTYTFEVLALVSRDPQIRRSRDAWYLSLTDAYATLIQEMAPELDFAESERRALQLLTLVLGSWMTMGRSRPYFLDDRSETLKATLFDAVEKIVGLSRGG